MASTTELSRLLITLTGDSTNFTTMLRHAMTAINQFAGQAQSALGAAIMNPLAAVGSFGTKSFGKFDHALKQSLAIMAVSDEQINQIRESALRLATQGPQGPEQLAHAYYYLTSAGLSAEQSIQALPVIQKFATAGMFDLERATTLAKDAQFALGMVDEDAYKNKANLIRITDVLTRANILANATTEQFSISLTTKAAAALKVLGKDVEEGVAMLAVFANQGVKASLAGNAMSIVLRDLQTKAVKFAPAFKQAGVRVFDARGEMRNFADIVEDLEKKLGSLSDAEKRRQLLMLGFQDRSVAYTQMLLGTSKKMREFEKDLRNAMATEKKKGTTDEVAEKQMKSFVNQMKVAHNWLVILGIEIGEQLAPAMEKVAELIGAVVNWFRELSPEVKQVMVITGAAVTTFGALLIVVGLLRGALGLMAATMGGLMFYIPGLSGAFTLLRLAVGGVWFAVTQLVIAVATLPVIMGRALIWMTASWKNLFTVILAPVHALMTAVSMVAFHLTAAVWGTLLTGFRIVKLLASGFMILSVSILYSLNWMLRLTAVLPALAGAMSRIRAIIVSTFLSLRTFGVMLATVFNPLIYIRVLLIGVTSILRVIPFLLTNVFRVITMMGTALSFLLSPAVLIIGLIAVAAAMFAGFVSDMGGMKNAWEEIKKRAKAAWEWLEPTRRALGHLFRAIWQAGVAAWKILQAFVSRVWKRIFGEGTSTWNGIQDAMVDVIRFMEFTITNFGEVWAFTMSWMRLTFIVAVAEVWHFFSKTLPAVMGWFVGNFGSIMGAIGTLIFSVFQGLVDMINDLFSKIDWAAVAAGAKGLFFAFWKAMSEPNKLAEEFNEKLQDLERREAVSLGEKEARKLTEQRSTEFLVDPSKAFQDVTRELGKYSSRGKKTAEKPKGILGAVETFGSKMSKIWQKIELPDREPWEVETQLRKEYEAQKKSLGVSFQHFKMWRQTQDKIEDAFRLVHEGVWGTLVSPTVHNNAVKKAGDMGEDMGEEMATKFGKEVKKMDAALMDSAEALERYYEYKQHLEETRNSPQVKMRAEEEKAKILQERQARMQKRIADMEAEIAKKVRWQKDAVKLGGMTPAEVRALAGGPQSGRGPKAVDLVRDWLNESEDLMDRFRKESEPAWNAAELERVVAARAAEKERLVRETYERRLWAAEMEQWQEARNREEVWVDRLIKAMDERRAAEQELADWFAAAAESLEKAVRESQGRLRRELRESDARAEYRFESQMMAEEVRRRQVLSRKTPSGYAGPFVKDVIKALPKREAVPQPEDIPEIRPGEVLEKLLRLPQTEVPEFKRFGNQRAPKPVDRSVPGLIGPQTSEAEVEVPRTPRPRKSLEEDFVPLFMREPRHGRKTPHEDVIEKHLREMNETLRRIEKKPREPGRPADLGDN